MKAAVKPKRCKACRKADATVQFTLCAGCYADASAVTQKSCTDISLTKQELEDLVISFFIQG